jgi:T5orf172 domain
MSVLSSGYVYVFFNPNLNWVKVGMTDKDDQKYCENRLFDYLRSHSIPSKGWAFICAFRTNHPSIVEKAIHEKLRPFKVSNGSARELFSCSPIITIPIIMEIISEYHVLSNQEEINNKDDIKNDIYRYKKDENQNVEFNGKSWPRDVFLRNLALACKKNDICKIEYDDRYQKWRKTCIEFINMKSKDVSNQNWEYIRYISRQLPLPPTIILPYPHVEDIRGRYGM